MARPSPFALKVPPAVLTDLRERLQRTRWPDQAEGNEGWLYGTELGFMKRVAEYWAREFDWAEQERRFNAMPQFTLNVGGKRVHFVHSRCPKADAPVLLLCHGWPGSVFEFHKVLPALAESFHVVAPSIPGYGFSEPASKRGMHIPAVARVFDTLMRDLGYSRYVAQGGDWGSVIVQSLARLFPSRCVAIHINMPTPVRPKSSNGSELTPTELKGLKRAAAFGKFGMGYQKIQQTKPQTLSYGLNDSPVGLAAWIIEKFQAWSDCSGDVTSVFSLDELLTNIMIYWVSSSIGSSMRLYFESQAVMPGTDDEMRRLGQSKVKVPTAVAQFPHELFFAPKSWCEGTYNLHRYTLFEGGGHFAALEKPRELVEDIKAFFLPLLTRDAAKL
eukprot:Hpha_TRINITY_DN10517_c0_g1::TRINITY_DN10517_c0_g1_i1::g.31188::m.31188